MNPLSTLTKPTNLYYRKYQEEGSGKTKFDYFVETPVSEACRLLYAGDIRKLYSYGFQYEGIRKNKLGVWVRDGVYLETTEQLNKVYWDV